MKVIRLETQAQDWFPREAPKGSFLMSRSGRVMKVVRWKHREDNRWTLWVLA